MLSFFRTLTVKFIPTAIQNRIYQIRHDNYGNVISLFKTFRNTLYQKAKITNVIYRHQLSFSYIRKYCVDHIETIDAPLLLISQIPRSGGSLLSQLFDGHPAALVHPHELKIGYPKNTDWPRFSENENPSELFAHLFEHNNIQFIQHGYYKGKGKSKKHRFYFIPSLQREIFLKICSSFMELTDRHILNAYFTSYFNTWLNYRGPLRGKYVIAFAPWLANDPENVHGFFSTYPDGKMISILREPCSWYASTRKKSPQSSIDTLANKWNEAICAMLRNKKNNPSSIILLRFEDLVSDPKKTMLYICNHIGLDYLDILSTPTFNSEPISANSSFTVKEDEGILKDVVSRKQYLDTNEIRFIEKECIGNYQTALNYIESI